jgi:hypothetical protein
MLSPQKRSMLLVIALLLFVPIIGLQTKIDPQRAQYLPGGANARAAASHLPIEFALGAMTGFREAVAGLLWVRTDEFFHNGDYEAITPMIRIITWLDPHQTDVYQTGAWHMDYNFTDASQRSDRRYIPLSLALMREGIQNNDNIPDLYSDLAFTHYFRKIGDFPNAEVWFRKGQDMVAGLRQVSDAHPKDPDLKEQADDAATSVVTIGHGLAHALEAEGKIPEAIAQWQYCVQAHQKNLATDLGKQFGEASSMNVAARQLREMEMRQQWRARDTKVPEDVHFSAQLVRVAPKIFVVKGTMNVIGATQFTLETGQATWGPVDGCRVEVRLQDAGYKMPDIKSFSLSSLNLDPSITIMQDAVSVRKGKFERKMDMSQDPTMYSFTAPKYTVTLWFNPSNPNDCPPNAQDRIGWLGQGMTDAHYLDTSGNVPGDTVSLTPGKPQIPGLRQIKKVFTLTKEDILGQGEKTFN